MYEIMKNLINNKFYKEKGEIIQKLSVFYAYKVINDEQYAELMNLTNEKYKDVVEQPQEKPVINNTIA